ncbi:Disintegrin and metalloproteinase domain-containing protein 18 [Myotis brandtii]|uniref:Disintegrin and metalloproteinase domain-containing protein 2 n=1 Tax=Myotis brandtii TaxID=109478 RepID=S7MBQ4_MYOBR|nr:Disintegrin and metalloproteinase domain-containing protein 18 [Myotis brandtii]
MLRFLFLLFGLIGLQTDSSDKATAGWTVAEVAEASFPPLPYLRAQQRQTGAGATALAQILCIRPLIDIYREKSDYVGATFQGKMCDRQYGGGIAVHPKTLSLESLAVIIAQLLSLSMGIAYDDIDKCQCSGAVCIMNPEAIHSSGVKIFSNCSMEDFAHFISKPKSQCLRNHPRLDPSYKAAVCGDKKVEEGETCDCGTADLCKQQKCVDNDLGYDCTPQKCSNQGECQFKKCCDYNTCKLKGSVKCGSGLCCTPECQISVAGTPCRKSADQECDFTEYCNGTYSDCVPDTYALNGHYCENKTCQEIDLKKSNCNATTKCKGNGICNNLGNCHCFPGYRPPDCEFQIGSPGGSIDDGNVQKSGE